MARDHGLMDRAEATGEAVFSVYFWERPTLSLGRNQHARGHYDLAEIGRRGIDVVRRPTGGRALLHHREVTYSVAAPLAMTASLRESYAAINRILLSALARLGVRAGEARRGSPQTPRGTLPCFGEPAQGELVTNGGKLVGSAQLREGGAMLQHGSILIEDDQGLIPELLRDAMAGGVPRPATLRAAIGREPAADEVATAIFDSLRNFAATEPVPLGESDLRAFTTRHISVYSSEDWTWRL